MASGTGNECKRKRKEGNSTFGLGLSADLGGGKVPLSGDRDIWDGLTVRETEPVARPPKDYPLRSLVSYLLCVMCYVAIWGRESRSDLTRKTVTVF